MTQNLNHLDSELDWRQTVLGACETWSQTLKTTADLVLAGQFPMMLLWGPQLVQIYNHAYRDLIGDKRAAGLGQPMRDCWPEAWHASEPIYRRVSNGESVTLTDQLLPATPGNGRLEHASFTVYYSPVRDEAAQVAGVLVTVFQTAGQRRAERDLQESAERFRALMTANSDLVYRMTSDWSEMQQLDDRGVPSGTEGSGSDWLQEHVHPDDQSKVLAAIQHSIRNKTTYELEHRVQRADGRLGWTLSRAVPVLDETGTIREWFGTATDITIRKQDEARRFEAEARQSFLLQLHDRLHLLSDPVRIQFEAASALGEHLSVNRVGYAEASADGEFVNITTAYVQGLAEVSGQHRLEDYGPEMLAQFRSGRTIAFDDVANDPRLTEPQKSAHELLEARANLNVPLLRAGQLRAVLFVHSKVRRVWTAGEVTLLEQVAARTWDAVERARAELTLARRAAELEAILASMPDALYIGDHTGIHRANQLALDQLGFKTFEELVADIAHLGERIQTRDLKTGKRFRPEEEPFVRALHGESVAHEVAITHLITGDEVIVRCSARPIRLEGRIIGAVAINTDITAEKRAEEALARQAKELARSNDDLHQFAHVAAHDLQAPLRMVRSYAQLLQRRFHGRLDAAADGYIDMIMDGVETMQQLTEGLLNLAQAGEALGEYADIRIETVIDGALTNLQPMIHETGAEVTCGELPTVYADRLQMLQLFQNLIGNALKYRDPQRHPRIRITAETRDRTHSFAVADNGIGIDQIHYQDIFAPLKRLHGKNIPGTGIGLAVCKKIIERHGGRIWVDSQPGDGSVFHFTLPVN